MSSLYDILELPKYASLREVQTAFKRLAVKYHPDRNPGRPELEEKFKELSHAYTILGDEESKREYDIRLSGFYSELKNKPDSKEDETKKRRAKVAEMLRKRQKAEQDKIISDWEKLHTGTPLWLRRTFTIAIIAVGVKFVFSNWFFSRETFSPIRFVFAAIFILTGNVMFQNLNYPILLYKSLKGKIRYNPATRVFINFLGGICLSVAVGIGGAHLMALYHFKNYPAITSAKVHVIYEPNIDREIKVVYTYVVEGEEYTKPVPEEWQNEALQKGTISVRYSYVDPMFSKILREE